MRVYFVVFLCGKPKYPPEILKDVVNNLYESFHLGGISTLNKGLTVLSARYSLDSLDIASWSTVYLCFL